jgi:hypothetical protein
MKIEATCDTCSRTFLLSQIGPESETRGRCPFCGARFARHYNSQLIEAVETAERSASFFVQALNRVQAMETGFDVDVDRLLESIAEKLHEAEPAPRSA